MCGILGYRLPEGDPGPFADRMAGALDALGHRGPDGRGTWFSPDRRTGLGHVRLTVIDPEGGAQPMVDPATGAVVVANAEIYSFPELFRAQEAAGRRPRTRSDTEALLTELVLRGEDALPRLRGMFAFAFYDPREDRLLLARDRMGQKPLFHAPLSGGGVAFASELPALLALLGTTPAPDPEALSLYLSFGYVPAPRTAFAGVRKLPAAHRLLAGEAAPAAYWRRPAPGPRPDDLGAAAEEIRERVRDAVRVRTVADVPLGAFLSGGLDSTAVVAFLAGAGAAPVRTFTVVQPFPEYDESATARATAARFGCDHEEIRLDPPDVEEIPALLARWGEPFGDSSALATALVSRAARRRVTVALTGDGGDEAFGGYDRFAILDRIGRVPAFVGRALGAVVPGRAGRGLRIAGMAPARRYYEFYETFNGGLRDELLDPGFRARHGDASLRFLTGLYDSFPGGELDRMLATDAATWLPDDLNPKVDVASMSVALECRSPLQDHLLVEAGARLPADVHVRRGIRKAVLRDAVGDLVPPAVLAGAKKGFAAPVEHWFRGDLRGFLESRLRGKALGSLGVVRREGVEEVLGRLDRGGGTGRPRIQAFVLLSLALFAERIS